MNNRNECPQTFESGLNSNSKLIVQKINDLEMPYKSSTSHKNPHTNKDMTKNIESISEPMVVDNSEDFDNSMEVEHQSMVTGIVVNGFHPQLLQWRENEKLHAPVPLNENMELDKVISKKVNTCRSEESENVRDIVRTKTMARQKPQRRFSNNTPIGEIFSEVFEKSNVGQIIATPGGRFGAWNSKFLEVCAFAPAGPYASLTIFDLVLPSAFPLLHQIFLSSLFDEFPEGKEKTEGKNVYMALTVPCIDFGKVNEAEVYITLSLMYDRDPDKRCFHCILTKNPKGKVGEIHFISQQELMSMLFDETC